MSDFLSCLGVLELKAQECDSRLHKTRPLQFSMGETKFVSQLTVAYETCHMGTP